MLRNDNNLKQNHYISDELASVFHSEGLAVIIILATVVLNATLSFLSPSGLLIVAGFATFLFLTSLYLRDLMAIQITLLTLAIVIGLFFLPWPLFFVLPLAVYGAVLVATPSLRPTLFWCQLGKFNLTIGILILVTVVISAAALLLWFFLLNPDLSYVLKLIPSWSPLLLLLSGLAFAFANAAIEETIYRGALMQALDGAVGTNYLSVILQAIPFGFIHITGVPGGWIGLCLATVYGLILGVIRRLAQGLFAPFVAHVCADLVIFSIVILFVPA